jgi:flagellar biosynthetic protein FliR
LLGFLAVLLRSAALCSAAPLFGTRSVPSRVRLSLAVLVGTAAFLAADQPALAGWERTNVLLAVAFGETLRGLAAGLAARLCLEAAGAAGHAISAAMGLGFGAMIDPIHGAESNAISEILSFTALGLAVAIGVPREAVAWLCRSVIAAPPGSAVDVGAWTSLVVADATQSIALAVRVAYPVLVAVTTGHLALGLLNRVTPQLGIGNIGFAVAILAGGGALYLVAPTAAAMVAESARVAFASG